MQHIKLGQLKRILELLPQDVVVMYGFTYAHSYRGYYDQVAFEPTSSIPVAHMLGEVERALTETFTGYKGGDFKYNEYTECWLANHGETGVALNVILGQIVVDAFTTYQ